MTKEPPTRLEWTGSVNKSYDMEWSTFSLKLCKDKCASYWMKWLLHLNTTASCQNEVFPSFHTTDNSSVPPPHNKICEVWGTEWSGLSLTVTHHSVRCTFPRDICDPETSLIQNYLTCLLVYLLMCTYIYWSAHSHSGRNLLMYLCFIESLNLVSAGFVCCFSSP